MDKVELIKKINKNIVHEDGTVDSFERQIQDLINANYDVRFPFVIKSDSQILNFISRLDSEKPLIMMTSTIEKISKKHHINYSYVKAINELLEKSLFAFDSLKYDTNHIIVLDDINEMYIPKIVICRSDKKVGYIDVNEIASVYDRNNFANFINRVYLENKTFYINDKIKTEQFINSFQSQLLDDLKTALSESYSRKVFTRSQVENDLQK